MVENGDGKDDGRREATPGEVNSDKDITPDWYGEADDRSLELGLAFLPRGAPLDRPRGMLSQRDREYLTGVSDVDPKSQLERNIRGDIRERVKNTLIDFTILLERFPPRDRRQIFGSYDAEVRSGIADTLGFLYHETAPTGYDFEELLELGIDRGEKAALRREGYSTPIRIPDEREYYNVDLQVERVSPKNPQTRLTEIGEMIERGDGEDLTTAEIRMFLDYYKRAEEFDPERPAEVFEDMMRAGQGWPSRDKDTDENEES